MFYDLFKSLCVKKGVSVSKACIEMGLSRSIAAKWKNTRSNPSAEVLPKIAQYFNVSTDYLLGNEPQKEASSQKDDSAPQLQGVYLRLAKGAQELGLDEEDVDTILALYRKHRKNNGQE